MLISRPCVVSLTWLLCGAALFAWHDLRAIPVGFALATLGATLLILRALPHRPSVPWWPVLGRPVALGAAAYGALRLLVGVTLR